MPFAKSGYYNNPQLGQAFENIASMFAPPTIQERAAAAAMKQSEAALVQGQAAAAAKGAAIENLKTRYPNLSLSDLMLAGDSDPVGHAGKLAQLGIASANPSNPAAQDAFNYANNGNAGNTFAGRQSEPLSADQSRIVPATIAATLGVPAQQFGVVKSGNQATLLPGGGLPSLVGAPPPGDVSDPRAAVGPYDPDHPVVAAVTRSMRDAQGAGTAAPQSPAGTVHPVTATLAAAMGMMPAGAMPTAAQDASGFSRAPNGIVTIGAPKAGTTTLTPRDYARYGVPADTPGPVQVDGEGKLLFPMKAGQSISIDAKAESAEEDARVKARAKRLNDISEAGDRADEDAALYDRFGDLLNTVQTGGRTAALEKVRQLTGVALDPNTDNVQALNAAVQYIAPRLRVAGSGAQSDRELDNFLSSIPSLKGTPEGNARILSTLKGVNDYKRQRAAIANDWQSGNLSSKDAQQRINELPSPFLRQAAAPQQEQGGAVAPGPQAGSPVRITSPNDATPAGLARLGLKRGDPVLLPDGTQGVVP